MPKKLIITNQKALTAKYGKSGFARIVRAVQTLITADKKRDLTSILMFVDKPLTGVPRVTSVGNLEQNKHSIDALCRGLGSPDYVMILGGPDVIPHQEFKNPVGDDEDPIVPSDLPYACEVPYSTDLADFLAPTRAIGRLPNVTDDTNASYLVTLINSAARFSGLSNTSHCFGLSAEVWRLATQENLRRIFEKKSSFFLSPPKEPAWPKSELTPELHFINCHGVSASPFFFGQPGPPSNPPQDFPDAYAAADIAGKVPKGCVVAVECCYGAELYSRSGESRIGIANTYLHQGASAVVGSTTIAYGSSSRRISDADILCARFMRSIVDGATTGRALLEARLGFLKEARKLDPMELKTIAQFLLLGDPSLRPFAKGSTKTTAKRKMGAKAPTLVRHEEGRMQLRLGAEQLRQTVQAARAMKSAEVNKSTLTALQQMLQKEAIKRDARSFRHYTFAAPVVARGAALSKAKGPAMTMRRGRESQEVHVLFDKPRPSPKPRAQKSAASASDRVQTISALVVRTDGGKVTSWKRVYAR